MARLEKSSKVPKIPLNLINTGLESMVDFGRYNHDIHILSIGKFLVYMYNL